MTGPVPAGIAAGSSIWATKASTLSGAAASQASRPCRSAASSGARRRTSNCPAAREGARSLLTVSVASR